MVPAKSLIVLGFVLALVLFISSQVAAKDLETVADGIEDDRGFERGGRGGGNNNGGGRGGGNNNGGGFNNGGGRGGGNNGGGFNNGGGRGGGNNGGGFNNGGGRGGGNYGRGFNGRHCRQGVCCNWRGYNCHCCYTAAGATGEAKP